MNSDISEMKSESEINEENKKTMRCKIPDCYEFLLVMQSISQYFSFVCLNT